MACFTENYPHLSWWVENHGWLELGQDEYSPSLLRLIDPGGVCWEDEESVTIDEALAAGEAFLVTELPERFGVQWNAKMGSFEDI